MKEVLFTGSGVAIVTPFKDGKVNLSSFGRLIDRQLAEGTDAIIVSGWLLPRGKAASFPLCMKASMICPGKFGP